MDVLNGFVNELVMLNAVSFSILAIHCNAVLEMVVIELRISPVQISVHSSVQSPSPSP